jgi:hypothetical protein
MPADPHVESVGPVLQAGSVASAVVRAIVEENPRAAVLDRGSYLRVAAPGRCVVTRGALERHLGRAFRLPGDLEAIMPSFAGRFVVDEDEARWESSS